MSPMASGAGHSQCAEWLPAYNLECVGVGGVEGEVAWVLRKSLASSQTQLGLWNEKGQDSEQASQQD